MDYMFIICYCQIKEQRLSSHMQACGFSPQIYNHEEPAPVVKQSLYVTFRILKKMYPKTAGKLMELKGYVDQNSYEMNDCVYPVGNNVFFFGFFSDQAGDLQKLLDAVSGGFSITHLSVVIVGVTCDYAKEIAIRMDRAFKDQGKPQEVYYTDFQGDIFYSVNVPLSLTAAEAGRKFASDSADRLLRHE